MQVRVLLLRKIFFISTISYIVGFFLAFLFSDISIIVPSLVLFIVLFGYGLFSQNKACIIAFSIGMFLGVCYFQWNENIYKSDISKLENVGETIIIRVDGSPSYQDDELTFDAVTKDHAISDIKLRVKVSSVSRKSINYGDIIRVNNPDISFPRDGKNFGDSSYRLYLRSQGITASLYSDNEDIKVLGNDASGVMRYIYSLKKSMTSSLKTELKGDEGGLVVGMITGDRTAMSDKCLKNMETAGLSHITAVSGMHLNTVIMLFSIIFITKKRYSRIKLTINILLCVFIVIFTGFGYSVIRAAIMTVMVNIAYLVSRRTSPLNSVVVTAILIMIHNPYSVFDMSFMLSLFATLSLVLFYNKTDNFMENKLNFTNKFFREIISVSLSVQILVVPLIMYYKNSFSLYSLLGNILVAPIIAFSMFFTILYLVISPFGFLAKVCSFILRMVSGYIIFVSETISRLPYASVNVSQKIMYVILFIAISIILIYAVFRLFHNKNAVRITALLCIFILLTGVFSYSPDVGGVEFINVGHGDCAYLYADGKNILIDTGGSVYGNYDVGANVVAPYLTRKGVDKLDIVFLTHFHADHSKGITGLMDKIDIAAVVMPYPRTDEERKLHNEILSKAKGMDIEFKYTSTGDRFVISENSYIDVINPDKDYVSDNENNHSLVLMFEYKGIKTLFCSDIEDTSLISSKDINAHILKVPHHGSDTSATQDFIQSVSPAVSVVSVGENNVYNLPDKSVMMYLNKFSDKVYRTDVNGTVRVDFSAGNIRTSTLR